ncbi:MAG: SufS family cysteine desulfurase [Eggerthellaceae bacterium]|nr:SufS family cysteine desulfurase [Eggerthellaceae bacterium]
MLTERGRAEWDAAGIKVSALVDNPFKRDFPLLATNANLAFLDSAATAQRPQSVIDAQKRFYETLNANALRGLYRLSVEATEAIGAARAHTARFLGLSDADARDIVFCRNASEALNIVASSFGGMVLGPGDEVCITIMEHHSNMIPWQQVCRHTGAQLVYLYVDESGAIGEDEIRAKIGPRTKIVSATHVSNILGTATDVAALAKAAHEVNAVMVVDGAQSAPHMPIDLPALDADFYTFSAHKAFGPFGIGVLWGRHELLDAMPPFLTGGEMISSVTEQDAMWSPVPEKFEAGTQDAAGIYALDAALDYIESVGFEAIQMRESALVHTCMHRLSELDFVRIIGPADPAAHHGVVSFNVCGIHPHDVASILDMDGVAIRAGHHCAQPLLAHLGIESCCRASLAFYNDSADIDKLVSGLKHVWEMFHG